jgi:hypothetical protein
MFRIDYAILIFLTTAASADSIFRAAYAPPITDHRSPITDHRSPITDHRSDYNVNKLKNVNPLTPKFSLFYGDMPEVCPALPKGSPDKSEVCPAVSRGSPDKPEVCPAKSKGQPVTLKGQPCKSKGQPSAAKRIPSMLKGKPATVKGRPVTAKKNPSGITGAKRLVYIYSGAFPRTIPNVVRGLGKALPIR